VRDAARSCGERERADGYELNGLNVMSDERGG